MSTQDTYVTPVVVASGTTWAQFLTGGLAIHIANMIANNPGIANPTSAATASATGGGASGGNLAAGAYLVSYTWCDGFGETTAGTSESTTLTVGAANIPRVTIPALPTGARCANLYLTAVGGASGTETLYATGITGTTFDCSFAAGSDPFATLPAANTTGAASAQGMLDLPVNEPNSRFFGHIFGLLDTFEHGSPIARADIKARHARHAAAVKMYATAMDEIGVLISANPGTLGTTVNTSSGLITPVRTWP